MSRKVKPTYLPVLRIVTQRHDYDCGVAALATLTGKNYEDVFHAYGAPVHRTGVNMQDIITAAEKLGVRMRLVRRVRLDEDFGILGVRTPKRTAKEHVVVLYDEHIYDTDGTVWEAEDFFKAEGWTTRDRPYTSIIKLDNRKRENG